VIPRIQQDDLPQRLANFLRPRIERLGYLGEFFQCTAHQPDALLSFLEFTEHLKRALPNNLTEVVALSVAVMMQNDYEFSQHQRLCLKLGFSPAWVAEIEKLSKDGAGVMSESEQLVQRLVVAVVERKGHDTTAELEAVTAAVGVSHSVAILMLIGRYMSHALIVNALNLSPPIPPVKENIHVSHP
jgi:alkylhydroperoxidase family enzyme